MFPTVNWPGQWGICSSVLSPQSSCPSHIKLVSTHLEFPHKKLSGQLKYWSAFATVSSAKKSSSGANFTTKLNDLVCYRNLSRRCCRRTGQRRHSAFSAPHSCCCCRKRSTAYCTRDQHLKKRQFTSTISTYWNTTWKAKIKKAREWLHELLFVCLTSKTRIFFFADCT